MKKILITIMAVFMVSTTVNAAEIPIESTPCYATPESTIIAEKLICDILDEVKNGMGFADAMNKANGRIYAAVLAGTTNGYGYALLSSTARNAIFQYRDMYLRPDYYANSETTVKTLIADLITEVQNGTKDYNTAIKEAYIRIYQTADSNFNPESCYMTDFCYWDIPPVDSAMFTVARKLLLK